MEIGQSRTWAEIDLSALEHNYHLLRSMLPDTCKLLAPVKADGYGHGAVAVAKRLETLGADYLAVAYLEEGIELRQAGIALPILILGRTDPCRTSELLRYQITQSVCCEEDAKGYSEAALSQGQRLRVHIKADTGMHRL
ncbi:MAG: alanine racemase, partial [Oscillospiraceae bacterium]|nr:alanine racemase [Oscillospiraceae bacterium]